MEKITINTVNKWLAENRPNLRTEEINGKKGVYDTQAGQASSFEVRGKTWADVLRSFEDYST